MSKLDFLQELRRMAYERGQRDYERAKKQAEPGQPLFKNNPHQNNHATDEAEHWDLGWTDSEQLEARDRVMFPRRKNHEQDS